MAGHDVVPARKANDANARDAQQDLRLVEADAVRLVADHGSRGPARHLSVRTAGLIASAAIGCVILVSQVGSKQPPVVAANDPPKGEAPVIAARATNEAPERPAPASEPSGPRTPAPEREQSAEGGIAASNMAAAFSDERTIAPPVAAPPIANPDSGGEDPRQAEGTKEAQSPSETTNSGTIAAATTAPATIAPSSEPLPQAASPSPPPTGKAGSTVDQTSDAGALRTVRAIIHVNMRAGPSNDKAVVARIPEGGSLQVVKCDHWCEVIFAGQRGWVYKGFIGLYPLPKRP
jgi:Bacterial SH3 domain